MSDSEDESSNEPPVSHDWLQEVLQTTYPNIRILDYITKSVENFFEYLYVTAACELDVNGTQAQHIIHMVVKVLPKLAFQRQFIIDTKLDIREVKFYETLLPRMLKFQRDYLRSDAKPLSVAVQRCFYTNLMPRLSLDSADLPTALESYIVLESMRPKGYSPPHFATGLTLGEAESALRSIAVVHALSLAMQEKQNLNINQTFPFLFEMQKACDNFQSSIENGMPLLNMFLQHRGGREQDIEMLLAIKPHTRSIIEKTLEPNGSLGVIAHMDFWLKNLEFRSTIEPDEGDNCLIMDWQLYMYSRPANDVALLIMSSLPSDVRRESNGRLLDTYYDALKDNLQRFDVDLEEAFSYSRDQWKIDYKQSQLLAFLLCAGSVEIVLGKPDAEKRLLDALDDLKEEGIFDDY